VANPVGTILSIALMFRYSLGLHKEARAIEDAVKKALETKQEGGDEAWSADLGGTAKTEDVGDAVLRSLEAALKRWA
jgi:3-isopropylmalate dehydrogenase